jgi:DNA polymerase sigma
MGIYIKHWAKRNKINGATEKYLSSYALLLMLIHFLQEEIKPSVLPILQKVENTTINYEYSHSDAIINCNVYFEEDMEKVKTYMNIINNNETNKDSVTELLIKFFEFYAYKYDQSFLISISNSEKKVPSSEHIAFPIEDPFDIEHNPGKSMKLNSPQYELFLNCMKKEINMLLSGEYVAGFNTVES